MTDYEVEVAPPLARQRHASVGEASETLLAEPALPEPQLFRFCLSLSIMPTTQPLTEAALQEARRQNALAQLRRRYDELDRLTGKTAAERVAELRERQRAS